MANILELAKGLHPNVSISKEYLSDRYFEVHEKAKKEIEWYIDLNPNNAPLLISGAIGSGKTTLLKNLNIENSIYIDISDLNILTASSEYEIVREILEKLEINIDDFGASFISLDEYHDFIVGNITKTNYKLIIIDGLDRFFERDNLQLISRLLFNLNFVWKKLRTNIIFVTPLHFCTNSKLIKSYEKAYDIDSIDDNYHIILATPNLEKENNEFWISFIRHRTNLNEDIITDEQILNIVECSGGILRLTLMVLFKILKEVYKNGDNKVKDEYIDFVGNEYQNKINEYTLIYKGILYEYINLESLFKIPENSEVLFLKDIPLMIYYKFKDRYECKIHPKVDINLIDKNYIPF